MTEIVETRNKRNEKRYGWKCQDCGAAAGAWPEKQTAEDSAKRHREGTYLGYDPKDKKTYRYPTCKAHRSEREEYIEKKQVAW